MAIDSRSQRVRYDTEGSIHVNPDNPSPNSLISKPFNFSYNPITSRTTDLQRFVKFLGTAGGSKFQQNYAILQQSQQELNRNVDKANKEGGTKAGNFLRQVGARALGTILGNVGFTANIAKQIPVNGTGTHFINNTSGRFYLDDVGGSGGVVKQLFKNFLKNTVNLDTTSFKGKLGFDPEGSGIVESNLKDKSSFLRFDEDDENNYFADNNTGETGDFNKLASKARNLLGGITNPIASLKSRLNASFGKVSNPLSVLGKDSTGNTFAFEGDKLGFYEDLYNAVQGIRDKKAPTGALVSPNIVNRLSNTRLNSIIAPDGKAYTITNTLASKFGAKNNTIASSEYFESATLDTSLEDEAALKDLFDLQFIPFSFHVITPDKSLTLFFNAFLDSFTDNFSGTWNGTQYIGRAEQFYTYQGFGRDINFGFKVAAFNKDDIKPIYRKLNLLAGTTAPTYSEDGNFMRGTLTRINIGDLVSRQNGFISGVDFSWNTSYPWEKDFTTLDSPRKRVPHVLDVSVKFTPIHNFNVKSDLNFDEGESFFGGNLSKQVGSVGSPVAKGIEPLPSTRPKVSSVTIPRKKLTGIVTGEADTDSFGDLDGTSFNQGGYMDFETIQNLPDSAFEFDND